MKGSYDTASVYYAICTHTSVHSFVYACMHAYDSACVHVCNVCMRIRVYEYVVVYMCTCT